MKILLNLLCTPLKFFIPDFIFGIGIPIVRATPMAPTAFLILWIPNKGILNFLYLDPSY